MTATIPAAAKATPLPKPETQTQVVDPQSGRLTEHGVRLLTAVFNYVNAGNRITPCSASGKNLITLQPNDAFPLLEKYVNYEVFAFTAEQTSDGSVTATVVPRKGTLATLKVYIDGGASQAGAGDVDAGHVYLAVYADHLDSGVGGFVLK